MDYMYLESGSTNNPKEAGGGRETLNSISFIYMDSGSDNNPKNVGEVEKP